MVNIIHTSQHIYLLLCYKPTYLPTYDIEIIHTFIGITLIVQPKLYLCKITSVINCTIFYTIFAYIIM